MKSSCLPLSVLSAILFTGFSGSNALSQQGGERSIDMGSQPVLVAFSNQTSDPVAADWIDFDGLGHSIGVIRPNETLQLQTFPGYLMVFSSATQRLSTFRASSVSGGVYGIVGRGGQPTVDSRIAVCRFPSPTNQGGTPAAAPTATMDDLSSVIHSILTGAPLPPTLTATPAASTQRSYVGVYRGKQCTFKLTWENADGSGDVDGMMIIEGDMASSFSGGETRPGFLEVEVSADLRPMNHKLNKVTQSGKTSWVGDYITLIEVN